MRFFITGHTGFKGTWLCRMLIGAGHEVTGYALAPVGDSPDGRSFFDMADVKDHMHSFTGDVRDGEALYRAMAEAQPEIVIHMAAQPLVRESYARPVYTYETNVMGTVNMLDAVRRLSCVKSVVNVTTDKVYDNIEKKRGYVETDRLDGYDPYSNSKSCSELVTHAYQRSFLGDAGVAVSTVRAGNVIGGGDFAKDRIVPDCARAAMKGETIVVRSPHSIRPFQFVLEPLRVYTELAIRQITEPELAGNYNVGPELSDCVTVGELTDMWVKAWGDGAAWEAQAVGGPHEAGLLMLDCTKVKEKLGWQPHSNIREAVRLSAEWYKTYASGGDIPALMDRQIAEK
jgi:CDP-glucose 4,6-dehydratase